MSELNYKGKGEHSVNQLEKICESQKESLYYKQIDNQKLLQQNTELLEALKELYNSCNPQDVTSFKHGNEFYVGSISFPSNKVIHKVNELIQKHETK